MAQDGTQSRVLVTGAAGTVGRATVAALLDAPDRPAIIATDLDSRSTRRALRGLGDRVEVVLGDLCNPATLAGRLSGVTAAVHLAAVLPPLADENPALADRVNIGGTKALLAALAAESPSAFFIYGSSISIYGDRVANPEIRVGDPLVPSEGDHYATTKIAAERAVMTGPLDWTILRLSAVMGGHKMSPLMFHMPLDTSLEILTAADAGRAMAKARLAQPALSGKVFNLGGGAACRTSFRAYLAAVFARIGLGRFDLPETAFATRNFHCGHYVDGDELEALLQFRQDSLADHLDEVARAWPWWRRLGMRLIQGPAKAVLARMSEPLAARRKGIAAAVRRFFGPTPPDGPAPDG